MWSLPIVGTVGESAVSEANHLLPLKTTRFVGFYLFQFFNNFYIVFYLILFVLELFGNLNSPVLLRGYARLLVWLLQSFPYWYESTIEIGNQQQQNLSLPHQYQCNWPTSNNDNHQWENKHYFNLLKKANLALRWFMYFHFFLHQFNVQGEERSNWKAENRQKPAEAWPQTHPERI